MATNSNEDSSATPVAKPPPLAAAADESSTNPSPTETMNLLPNGTDHSKANVHYRDCISGPRFQFLFWSLIFGCMIAVFDTTLMASTHPVITSYFNASNAASWFTTVFYLSMTISQPVFGRVSDTIGRRPVLLFAIIMFLISIIWCGVAGTVGSFIAARGVGGIGAGGVLSLASVLTSDMVKIEYRGIYQSYFNLASHPHPVTHSDFPGTPALPDPILLIIFDSRHMEPATVSALHWAEFSATSSAGDPPSTSSCHLLLSMEFLRPSLVQTTLDPTLPGHRARPSVKRSRASISTDLSA